MGRDFSYVRHSRCGHRPLIQHPAQQAAMCVGALYRTPVRRFFRQHSSDRPLICPLAGHLFKEFQKSACESRGISRRMRCTNWVEKQEFPCQAMPLRIEQAFQVIQQAAAIGRDEIDGNYL